MIRLLNPLICILFVACFTLLANAEFKDTKESALTPSNPIRMGIKVGINLTQYRFNFDIESKTKRGFLGSLAMEIPVSSHLFLQPEVGYSQYRREQYNIEDGVFDELNIDLIEAQFLAKWRMVEDHRFIKPYALAGAAGGYIFKSEVLNKGNIGDLMGKTQRFELAAALGAGLQMRIDKGIDFGIEARYLLGLTNLSKISGVTTNSRTLYLGAHLFF